MLTSSVGHAGDVDGRPGKGKAGDERTNALASATLSHDARVRPVAMVVGNSRLFMTVRETCGIA
jgi:hypothetical protein